MSESGKTILGVACPDPDCECEGPHSYWPEDKVAECSSGCGQEFDVSDEQLLSATIY